VLKPTDVHLLVGFLSGLGQPEDVELELGSMVWDVAKQGERDVDVTITRKRDGAVECFKGIEVKHEGRKNDVTLVEQLCQKLNDMPALTYRSIVSSSGYSDGARNKAEYHGIELFRFDEWNEDDHVVSAIPRNLVWTTRSFNWIESSLNFELRPPLQLNLVAGTRVTDSRGKRRGPRTLRELAEGLQVTIAKDFQKRDYVAKAANNILLPAEYVITIDDEPRLWNGRRNAHAVAAQFKGVGCYQEETPPVMFRKLVRDSDGAPIAQCAVVELANKTLMSLAVQGTPSPIACTHLPISERNMKKIRRYRWRRDVQG
jgi:Restriction endonuclease